MIAALAVVTLLPAGRALDNGLARTPPMGWNSWNKFACNGLNEQVMRATADAIATNGMKDAGYQYVNHRRLLADRPRRRRQHRRRRRRNFPPASKRSPTTFTARAEVRHLYRRRHQNLRRPPRQHGPRISGRPAICRVGRRLPQIRLVQHAARPERRVLLHAHARRARRDRPTHGLQHLRVGIQQALALGRTRSATSGAPPATSRTAGTAKSSGAATASCRSST